MDDLLGDLADVVVEPTALLDIVLTAVLIYGLLSLIQGTRAVRLVIGATILLVIYLVAQELDLRLLSAILQAGAVVGLVALVVVFQPELRRGLDRLGRVGSLGLAGPIRRGGLPAHGGHPGGLGGPALAATGRRAHRRRARHGARGHGRDGRRHRRRAVHGAADLDLRGRLSPPRRRRHRARPDASWRRA